MKKLGLALGGGGLKGLAHIGVLQVLEENRIPVAIIAGTSAGSIIAALYASGVSPRRMKELAINLKPADYIDYNITGLIKYFCAYLTPGMKPTLDGLIKGDKLEQLVNKWTRGKTLAEAKIPLGIIACDIDSGQEVLFSSVHLTAADKVILIREALLSEAVRSSSSIPATFVPCKFRNMQMVDGGIRNIVPVTFPAKTGAEYILAVNLGQETFSEKASGMIQIISRSLNILTYETSDTAEDLLADLIIYPRVKGIHLEDIEKADQIIRAGRRAAEEKINEIKKGLES